jgi:type I restriction enzyme S subunit
MWQGVSALTNDEGIVSPAYTICTPKDGILSKYAKYLFKFQPLINVFRGYSQGLVNDTLNLKFESFSQIEIILPPIQEQKKIVTILCSVDDAIQATQAVIDQTRRVKQGLLQQLLTRGIGHTRFKQTGIGEIPQSWELTTLGKIANKNSLQTGPFGSQLHASEYIESGIPVVMPKDIFDGKILDENIACVPEDVADRLMKHRLQAGDILFARRGDIGRCSLVRDSEVGWICGTGCLRARVKDKISPEFLIQFLQWPKTVKWLNENAVGQTMLNLNTQILANLPILVPPKHEQINITNIFESINDELDKLISEKSTLLSIKHGLMQDLLTGRIRVGDST